MGLFVLVAGLGSLGIRVCILTSMRSSDHYHDTLLHVTSDSLLQQRRRTANDYPQNLQYTFDNLPLFNAAVKSFSSA